LVTGLGTFLQASHWLEDCANFTPTPKANDKNSTNTTLSALQAASQSNLNNEQFYSIWDQRELQK
jgi:hypothetical protein